MKSNILFLIENIYRLAGTERATVNIANELAKNNSYSVRIMSLRTCKQIQEPFKSDNISIVDVDFKDNRPKYIDYLYLLFYLKRYIKENRINIVIGTGHAYNVLISVLPQNVVKIGWEHRIYEACPKFSSIVRKILYRGLDALITLSNEESQKYSFLNKNKIFVIPNAKSFEIDVPTDLNNKTIVSLGRLEKIKGFEDVIIIAKMLEKEFPDWHFEIYGDGSERDYLIELINQLGVEKTVSIHPATSDVLGILMRSSVYLMTSREECLPMSLIEAMSCGIPVVSYNCPVGPRNIICDQRDGFLVPPFDLDSLENKLRLLMQDDILRKKMGLCAYESALKYSRENVCNKWYNLIDTLSNYKA